MNRIVLVGLSRTLSAGLQAQLSASRNRWALVRVDGATEAREACVRASVDCVVVSEVLQEGTGAALLKDLRDDFPDMIRFLVATRARPSGAAISAAHQVLERNVDPVTLANTLVRAAHLQSLVKSAQLRRVTGRLTHLPSLPSVYAELSVALEDDQVGVREVSAILEKDMAMCAKLLQLVNSSFFGVGRRIANIEQAVVYLGVRVVKNLALTAHVFDSAGYPSIEGMSLEFVQAESLLTANLARSLLSGDRMAAEDAFVAGTLHDIGLLVLARHFPEGFPRVAQNCAELGMPLIEAEENEWGASHAQIGAYLLGLWGLPFRVVEAVAHHHDPRGISQSKLDVLGALHIADALINEAIAAHLALPSPDALAPGFVASLGMESRLPQWRELAENLVYTSGAWTK